MRFADALAAPGFGAIAEFKRRSPSAGDLRPDGDVRAVARAYEAAGARAMSVLVDERFAGSWDDLRAARAATSLPLIAKGFFSTAEHLRTAAEAGADATPGEMVARLAALPSIASSSPHAAHGSLATGAV